MLSAAVSAILASYIELAAGDWLAPFFPFIAGGLGGFSAWYAWRAWAATRATEGGPGRAVLLIVTLLALLTDIGVILFAGLVGLMNLTGPMVR